MKIDVIIPIYKPGGELFTLLDRLNQQSVAVRKIILMNTGRENFTELMKESEFAKRYPNAEVHHLEKQDFDHGGTRHEATGHSDAGIFVMMTQDALPSDRYLVEHLVENLKGRTAAAYARQLPDAASSELEKVSRQFNYPGDSRVKGMEDLRELGIKTFFCSNVCAAYRRDIYDELGGFERHTIFNEDMLYAAKAVKAGYQIAYEARAQVIHSHNYTNLQQLRRNFDLGVSQADHPEVFGMAASESEGMRLVKETWNSLKARKRLYRFPGFCLQCAFKYAGYLLGKHYKALPEGLINILTTNKEYWDTPVRAKG
ncbi:MAG: glycosyltransferase family 2 protein [Lachnospiraceae bacterium]|nr:glycosyltransferase family 2 protein [Lachnospiraceae bacterium]